MTIYVVKVDDERYRYPSSVDSVWLTQEEANQRCDYIHDNSDSYGDWYRAQVIQREVGSCPCWPRETRDKESTS